MADKPGTEAVKKYSAKSSRNLGLVFRRAQESMLTDPTLQNLEWPLAEAAITNDIKDRVGGNLFQFTRDYFSKYAK